MEREIVMAAPPKSSEPPPKPPLEDPSNEREVFATEVVGVASIHGNVTVTLANVRFDETTADSPKLRRVVA